MRVRLITRDMEGAMAFAELQFGQARLGIFVHSAKDPYAINASKQPAFAVRPNFWCSARSDIFSTGSVHALHLTTRFPPLLRNVLHTYHFVATILQGITKVDKYQEGEEEVQRR